MLDAGGLTAYRCRGSHVAEAARFLSGGHADFETYLRSHAGDVHAVLVDVADESFELDHLPHAYGRSRRRLIARRRESHARGSPLATALPAGRQADGRRDDRFVFATLARSPLIDPWLHALERNRAAVHGVYAVSQLAAAIAGRHTREPCLLVSLTHAGLRQTFVAGGSLQFSRLTSLPGKTFDEVAAACAAEAADMRRYLCAKRLAEPDAALRVVVLAHPSQARAFQEHCIDNGEFHFETLDLVAEAARQGMAASLPDSFADTLFAHMLARKPPAQQFARAAARRHWRLRRAHRAIDGLGWSAFAASLLFAAIQLPGTLRLHEATAELQAQNERDEIAYRALQQAQPSLSLPASELRELAAATETLARLSPGPAPLLVRLSRAMDALPAIELERLEWRIVGSLDNQAGPLVLLDVHARLSSLDDPAAGRRSIDELAERMAAAPAVRASILKMPFTAASKQPVRSSDAPTAEDVFVLRAVQKL